MSLATSTALIDLALKERLGSVYVDIEGVPTLVKVFIEDPIVEEHSELAYPSVSIKNISDTKDGLRYESNEDYEVLQTVHEIGSMPYNVLRKEPIPTSMLYTIETYSKGRVSVSRQLRDRAIRYKFSHKDFLRAKSIDGEDISLDMFWDGAIIPMKEIKNDIIIYKDIITIEVKALIAVVAADDVEEELLATSLMWDFYRDPDPSKTEYFDRRIIITDDTVTSE